MPLPHDTDFYDLPRAVQDRLLDSLHARFAPVPVLARLGARSTHLAWLAASAGALVVLCALCAVGFGKAETVLSLHPTPLVVAYAVAVGVVVAGLLQALTLRARVRELPFPPGVYLFPHSLIDARDRRLRVHDLAGLSSVAAAGSAVVLTLGGVRFTLPVTDASRVGEAIALVEASRQHGEAGDARERMEVDPLAPPAAMSPLAPQAALRRDAPLWERGRFVIGVLTGCALGPALYVVRNTLSDERMFDAAHQRDDAASYRRYAARGRRHKEHVEQVLLQRAELRGVVAQGTVEAIDVYVAAHEKTGIRAELDAARRAALAAELEGARKAGTLAALLTFAERHPDHGMGPTFDQAKRALYAAALDRYKRQMPADAAPTVAVVERLLAYSERTRPKKDGGALHGPVVDVRFRRQSSRALFRADGAVSRNPMFNGMASLPAGYFDAAHLLPHETGTAEQLARQLGSAFDPEMLGFRPGAPVDGSTDALPAFDTPTLVVTYRVEWSGGAIATKIPRGVFIGLFFFFATELSIPGDADPLRTKYTSSQNVPRGIVDQHGAAPPPGTVETAVYQAMTHTAFDELRASYVSKWLRDGAGAR